MRLNLGVLSRNKGKIITATSLAFLVISAWIGSYLRLYPVFNSLDMGYDPMLNELDPYSEYW
ncbi:MAG: hypothetical protein QXP80_04025, partial [Zestosphaera sp.]